MLSHAKHCPIHTKNYIWNNHCPKTPPHVSTQYKTQSFSANAQSWSTSASQSGKSFFLSRHQLELRRAAIASVSMVSNVSESSSVASHTSAKSPASHRSVTLDMPPSLSVGYRTWWGTLQDKTHTCAHTTCTHNTHTHTRTHMHTHTHAHTHTHMHTHIHTICQCSQYVHMYPNISRVIHIQQWVNQQAFIGEYIICCS